LTAGDETTRRAVTAAVDQLEHDVRLLRLNLNESAALENFLLSSLRIWSRRG
jgi:DNA polymerase-3 subunit delta'